MVRAVFRRSDRYLLGFYVENRDASRRVFYTFTEQVDGRTRDMVPGNVYTGVRREYFGWGVNCRNSRRFCCAGVGRLGTCGRLVRSRAIPAMPCARG
jgi:hypothetical protein